MIRRAWHAWERAWTDWWTRKRSDDELADAIIFLMLIFPTFIIEFWRSADG